MSARRGSAARLFFVRAASAVRRPASAAGTYALLVSLFMSVNR